MSDDYKNKDPEKRNTRDERQRPSEQYRAKPKLVEIFSNTSRKPRLKNANPLDLEKQAKEAGGANAIVDEQTAATMQTELLTDGSSGENVIAFPGAMRKQPKKEEEDYTRPRQQDNRVVTLAPEFDDNTQFSREVLDEVEQFRESGPIESFDSIDIDMDSDKQEQERRAQEEAEHTRLEKTLSAGQAEGVQAEHIVSKVPVYRPDEPDNLLNVKAGRFAEVVGREYDAYSNSKNSAFAQRRNRSAPTRPPVEPPDDISVTQERILGAVVGFFSKDEAEEPAEPEAPKSEKPKPVEDYTGKEDEKSIQFELDSNTGKLIFRSILSGVIALVAIAISVITRLFPGELIGAIPVAPAAYAVFNFLLVASSLVLNRVSMGSGLGALFRLKGSSDSAVAIAGCAALVQTVVSFFFLPGDMSSFNVNYYCDIVLTAFFANNLGKLLLVLRVKDNFRFLSAEGQKYAAKIYNNESMARQMLSGTLSENDLIAYQHKTGFATNFLKISYAPDPSEDMASRLAPITAIAAIAVSVLYGILRGNAPDAFNTFALLTALSIPISNLLSVNIPVRRLCKTLNDYDAMLAGFPAIKQFCDSTAIMIDAEELFPADYIDLQCILTYEDYNVDESLLCGIAILKEAHNPIANAFEAIVNEANETLPDVESVLYEDGLGLVGWVNSERLLVGSRELLETYKVELPAETDEESYLAEGSQVTFLSRAGRAVAMLVTRYEADPELQGELQRAEANGICFLIRTTDFNLTDEQIAKLYNLFYRSIKVLPTGLGSALREAKSVNEEESRSYLITRGKTSSLARAISGCVKIRQNISMAVVIQMIAVILGLLIAAPLALYAGAGVMGTLEVSVYALFWALAAIIAPSLQKP